MKLGVIILNYKNYEVTLDCLNSLKRDLYTDKEIIIVDNGSHNASSSVLREYINDKPHYHLLILDKNLGFACGNNAGIKYAREKLKCEAVLLVNSDTIFCDVNCVSTLVKAIDKKLQ